MSPHVLQSITTGSIDAMTSVYNLLREACGISQAEAAEHVHGTRLDTVKSWSSDRRPAPGWAINHLQSLHRRIHAAGINYAEVIKKQSTEGNTFVLRIATSDDDARWNGFPSLSAQRLALAIAISQLPDDADIRIVDRGILPVLKLPPPVLTPTETDRKVLMSMKFDRGIFLTRGNVNRRKFERLEELGWVKHVSVSLSDVAYHITEKGRKARQIKIGDHFHFPGNDVIYRVTTVRGDNVILVDAEGKKSQALAGDIDNCWIDA
ncbi:hypothetical protein IVB56_24890 [Bradyrhizobium sp. CW7]|uniref:hypothetical protein n=1 Tax=Bradyrhizobium sp. CW7 TaxID=2782688 RepID=UPI001FF88CC5|nr:hypothetical protein [Bradyrhizobium sp. CW7]MCK1354206.1 hypothetical protein [Bradyrhizobium sp. CW7]